MSTRLRAAAQIVDSSTVDTLHPPILTHQHQNLHWPRPSPNLPYPNPPPRRIQTFDRGFPIHSTSTHQPFLTSLARPYALSERCTITISKSAQYPGRRGFLPEYEVGDAEYGSLGACREAVGDHEAGGGIYQRGEGLICAYRYILHLDKKCLTQDVYEEASSVHLCEVPFGFS